MNIESGRSEQTPRVPMPEARYITHVKQSPDDPDICNIFRGVGVFSKTDPSQKEEKPFLWVGNIAMSSKEEAKKVAGEFLTKIIIGLGVRCVFGPPIDFEKCDPRTEHVETLQDNGQSMGLYVDPNKHSESFITDHLAKWPQVKSLRTSRSTQFSHTLRKVLAAFPSI